MAMTTLDRLLAIAYGYEQQIPDFDSLLGLCRNCYLHDEIESYCGEWPEWNGYLGYPVDCPSLDNNPELMSPHIRGYYSLPLYSGEYGELRRNLARHIAHCIIRDRE